MRVDHYLLNTGIKMKIKTTFYIVLLFLLFSCGPKYKYKIFDRKGEIYYCNTINVTNNGCVMFNNHPGLNNTPGIPTIICGYYRIKKLKN